MARQWGFYTSKEIKPGGWLKRQLEIQAKGLSGNLDRVWRDVRDSAWIGGTAEGWERVPYWLDGFIPLAYLLEDEDMISRAKKYIDSIVSFQKEDGWICPCKDEERAAYDTWAVLLISKVFTVYYECSGDERIPGVIYKILKNYYELLKNGEVALFNWGKYRWYEGFIAIEFVYDRFREEWLLELARILKKQGMDYGTVTKQWERPLNRWTFDTHIVNLVMMLKAEAVSSDLLGEEYSDHAEYLHQILDRYNGTPVGLYTGDECLSGLSPIQGTELCAVVEQMYSCEQLYAYTGDKKWAERLEVLAFNALPAMISDDMWAHQYVQMSNQISCEKFPGKSLFRTNNSEAHVFGLEPHYGCCTANFNQGWPKLALSTFMHNGDTIIHALPVASRLDALQAQITVESDYPFENSMRYLIDAKTAFTFQIRVPSFAKEIRVEGKEQAGTDLLTFHLEAGEHRDICVSFETEAVFVDRPHDFKTVKRGSLVFSIPILYEERMSEYERDGVERKFPYCDYEYVGKPDWNYAYCDTTLKTVTKGISDIPFSSANPPVVLKAKVKKIDWGCEDGYDTVCAKLPASREPLGEAEEIELYPYGCAKLRMTEVPMIK